jgi:hypothetical protein
VHEPSLRRSIGRIMRHRTADRRVAVVLPHVGRRLHLVTSIELREV